MKETVAVTLPALQGTFKVSQVAGTELGMVQPTIIADSSSSKISGYAGCNTYTASYAISGNSVSFTNMATTKADCIQGMEQERKFTEAIAKVNRHTLENGKLTLYQDDIILVTARSIDL